MSESDDDGPKLLAGGNPQIAKGDGDGPVQDYLDAMPGWKGDVGRKAVRWNSPFYGTEDLGWFLSFHCFTRYVKVTFLNGASLDPLPPVASKDEATRYLHIHEDEEIDEQLFTSWLRQASRRPGWTGFST
jgi:hypothetical protein